MNTDSRKQIAANNVNNVLAVDFLSFFQKNRFLKNGNYYKHEDLINLTIANSTILNQIQFTIGFQNDGGSFFGISKNIKTVQELQEILMVLCGFKTYR